MFKVGIDIGEIRREEATQFDKGFTAGFDAGYERGYDEAMRDVRELDDGYERGFDRGYLAALEDLGIGDRRD